MAEGVACLPLRGSRSVCMCQHHVPWNVVLTSASTYSTFLFNCTLQYTRIIVEYSVIVGRSLVWLETKLNLTMTILLFSSILLTKRQWHSSTNTRPVWQCQKSLGCRVRRQYLTANIKIVNWPDCGGVQIETARKCNIKHHRQLYNWLVLPPYTVKIRGGHLGIIIEMSCCPTTQHS